ncbi:translation machinery-associated protein 20 [Favolaschia claudopus]|uniref:Translation machinery-associated protein 20 n=1 Tax=Favolaschia claudopus TaxID=2862362 RepID=A0AAW0EJR4_9AGAR
MAFHYSDFQPATSRKKRLNRDGFQQTSLATRIQRARELLAKEDWIIQCHQVLQEHLANFVLRPSHILCLGLGSPSSSPTALAQLAFLLEICRLAAIEHPNVSIYDPVFSQEDTAFFQTLGFNALPDNKEGKHTLDVPTILWMPHCDLDLYENLLSANWSPEKLERMVLISNRLSDYVESNPKRKLETRAPCLVRIESALLCHLLPHSSAYPTAFNTIAVQSSNRASELPASWFSSNSETRC